MSLQTYGLVALGGALGSTARYGLSVAMLSVSHDLPWGTILINVVGAFVIGFVGTLTLAGGRHAMSEDARVFVMVGLCGGFTTFSSFSLQTLDLLRGGAFGRAFANIVLSVVLTVLAAGLGHLVAARLNGGAEQVAQIAIEEEG